MQSPAPPDGSDRPGGADLSSAAARDRVHEQVRTLASGGAAEIDTAGGAIRVVSLLARTDGAGDAGDAAPILLLRDPAEFPDYFPHLTAAAARTAARWWPDAVTVEVDGAAGGLAGPPPGSAFAAAARTRTRCPADPEVAAVLELSPAPLIQVGGSGAGTVVHLRDDGRWSVIAEGALTERELIERQGETIVLVCTGNTCRSPLAEALLRHRLAAAGAGAVRVISAGLSAGYGAAASPESVDLARRAGADLSAHRSQPLTQELLDGADRVLCMTAGHRAAILRHRPDVRDRVALLDPGGGDIPDPIGGGMEEYEDCREAIDRGLDALVSVLGITPPPDPPLPGRS